MERFVHPQTVAVFLVPHQVTHCEVIWDTVERGRAKLLDLV